MKKTILDNDGQPFNRLYNAKRLNDRTIDELIGISKGIIADGKVNTAEAQFMLDWMVRNARYSDDVIVNLLYSRIKGMLIDNVLDREEQAELMELLSQITGEHCPADKAEATAATFPLDNPAPVVDVPRSAFCFTGKFAYGPRRECEAVVKDLGGIVKSSVSALTDYLVIGSLCSTDWIHTTYGRKIEQAMEYRNNPPRGRKGLPAIKIIHEDHWAGYVFTE